MKLHYILKGNDRGMELEPGIHPDERVSGKLPPRKIAPRSGSEFGLGLALELGLGGNFPRTEERNQDSPETNLGLLQHSR